MSSYLIEPPSPSDLPSLAVIQLAGFASDFDLPLWRPVLPADYEEWALRCLHNPEIPSGTTAEIRAARDGQTDKIVGYGLWSIPDLSAPRQEQYESFKNRLPRGLDAGGVEGFCRQMWEAESSALGTRPHITLHTLVVNPSAQGRGAGRALLKACTQSADDKGMGAYVVGSPVGQRLYKSMGFEGVKDILLDDGSVLATAMVREPVAERS